MLPREDMKLTQSMIKVAAIKPTERMKEIMGWRKELAYENQPKVAAWGLQVKPLSRWVDPR